MNYKKAFLGILILMILMQASAVSAKVLVEKNPIIDVIIPGTNLNASYQLKITNLGENDSFRLYSLVGVKIIPNNSFYIAEGETKTIDVTLSPEQSVLSKSGTFVFVYKIEGGKMGIQNDDMLIRIVNLKDAMEINSYNINLDSNNAVVYVKNKIGISFPEVRAVFHSGFFNFSQTFSINPYEKKEFEINLNKEKIKEFVAGTYIIDSEIETYGIKAKIENNFRFTEKEEITTRETKKGFIIAQLEIEKSNEGNLPTMAGIEVRKNIISRLFTTFNAEPSKIERSGLVVRYLFTKEIDPGKSFVLKVTTNWIYPLIILIAIIFIVVLVREYSSTFLVLKKRATFVKTKGGEFALKITLTAKAKDFVEKISIWDKIPSLMKVHKRFGAKEPDRIDEKNRRLEWNIGSLHSGEERVFSYILYSKVAPVGKFELPTATATFEKEGKLHESSSNQVFFITEPRKRDKDF